jgi:hypothetical protein
MFRSTGNWHDWEEHRTEANGQFRSTEANGQFRTHDVSAYYKTPIVFTSNFTKGLREVVFLFI